MIIIHYLNTYGTVPSKSAEKWILYCKLYIFCREMEPWHRKETQHSDKEVNSHKLQSNSNLCILFKFGKSTYLESYIKLFFFLNLMTFWSGTCSFDLCKATSKCIKYIHVIHSKTRYICWWLIVKFNYVCCLRMKKLLVIQQGLI